MTEAEEARYTLAEARKILQMEKCEEDGHLLDQELFRTSDFGGRRIVNMWLVRCTRCDLEFKPIVR